MTTATLEKPTIEGELAAIKAELVSLREGREATEVARLKARIASLQISLQGAGKYCSDCGDELDETCDTPLEEDDLRELAKARTALMNGKCDEGRDMLERVLDRAVGDKWRLFC